jgi:Domain of unknown function (DUF6265)
MKSAGSFASVAAFLLSAAVFAQISAPAPSRAVLSDLSWMSGRWIDDSGGNLSEEIWSAPSGDSMMGMWRYVSGGEVRIFELLTVSVEPTGIVMRLRHFDPDLAAREDKGNPVTLALVGWKPREAAFEGPAVGAPGLVRLTYRRLSEDTLTSTLEKDGRTQEFTFRRAKPQS